MDAIILAAGIGSRLKPHTDKKHKSLLPVGGTCIMQMMISNLLSSGIKRYVIVTGNREEDIKKFVSKTFPKLDVSYVRNDRYLVTNTAYSLMLAESLVKGKDFIKLDGDVVFEKKVVDLLIKDKNSTCLCIDTNINLAAEEVKVTLDKDRKVIKVGKGIPPKEASGESIGIEKISKKVAPVFFDELKKLLKDPAHHQDYYDDSYTTLVDMGIEMHAVDITGLKWVEIDTHEDYALAKKYFGE